MKKALTILFLCIISLSVYSQRTLYVQPADSNANASDSNIGTDIDYPLATWKHAFRVARPGDTVYFRGGVYMSTKINTINPERSIAGGGPVGFSGKRDSVITYSSYPGEWAILDCARHVDHYGMFNGYYNKAISINYVEHIHFKDFEVRNVFQLDSVLDGAIYSAYSRYLTFEHIILHHVGQRGYYVRSGAWKSRYDDPNGTSTPPYWDTADDTTRWINCDVYDLCDTLSPIVGNGADGFHTSTYKGNYFYWEGCRVWYISDDAWNCDGINGGLRVYRNCWAMASDKYKINTDGFWTERNGFKVGLGGMINTSTFDYPDWRTLEITNCLAMFCKHGFYEITVNNGVYYNNTGYRNGINFSIGTNMYPGNWNRSTMRNNIAWGSRYIASGIKPYDCYIIVNPGEPYPESHNTWDLDITEFLDWVYTDSITVTYDADLGGGALEDVVYPIEHFVTLDSLTLDSLFRAPRQADGSLPLQKPMMLKSGSDLIDAGYDVGLSYNGPAPDIGAFEYDSEGGVAETPTVTTNVATQVTKNSASCGGNVTHDGGASVSARGVCYNTTGTPTTGDDYTTDGTGDGVFTSSLTGLTEGTTYYVRAYATNSEGTAYGDEVTFETPSNLPLKMNKIIIHLNKVIKW